MLQLWLYNCGFLIIVTFYLTVRVLFLVIGTLELTLYLKSFLFPWQLQLTVNISLCNNPNFSVTCLSITLVVVCLHQVLHTSCHHLRTSLLTYPRMLNLRAKQRRILATWPIPGTGRRTTSTSRSKVMIEFTTVPSLRVLNTEAAVCVCVCRF